MSKFSFCFPCLPLVAAALLFASEAQAQPICGDRGALIKALDAKYEEKPAAFGIAGQKTLVELFTSKSGSWTMLMTQPGGITCILATGQSWEQFPATAKMTGL